MNLQSLSKTGYSSVGVSNKLPHIVSSKKTPKIQPKCSHSPTKPQHWKNCAPFYSTSILVIYINRCSFACLVYICVTNESDTHWGMKSNAAMQYHMKNDIQFFLVVATISAQNLLDINFYDFFFCTAQNMLVPRRWERGSICQMSSFSADFCVNFHNFVALWRFLFGINEA